MLNNYQTGSDISRKWSIRSVVLSQPLNHIQHRIIKEITSTYIVFHAEGLSHGNWAYWGWHACMHNRLLCCQLTSPCCSLLSSVSLCTYPP